MSEVVKPFFDRSGRPPLADGRERLIECARHGIIEHRLVQDAARGARWRCKRCIGEAVTRRHRKLKTLLVQAAGGSCVVCGYARCLVNLHFHHVDPATKRFGVAVSSGKGLAKSMEEARKCVLVCANCHGEIEAGLIACPPLGTGWVAE